MKNKHILKTIYISLLIAIVLVVTLILLQIKPVSYKEVNKYVSSDVTYSDGSSAHFDDKNFGNVNKGDVVSLHILLPESSFFDNSILTFYDYNTVTQVYHGDTLLDSHGEDSAEKGMMIGNHYFFVSIPDEAWGSEITIVLHVIENDAFSGFDNLRIYPSETVCQFYTDGDVAGLVVTLSLFLFSLLGIFGLVFSKAQRINIRNGLYISFTALLVALWMVSNRGIYNLFGFTAYFWELLEYISAYALSIPLLMFFRSMTKKKSKWRLYFNIFVAVAIAFFVVANVLNFSNIVHFDSLMDIAIAILILSVLLILCYIVLVKPKKDRHNALITAGMSVFIVSAFHEMAIRYFFPILPYESLHSLPSVLSLGILALFACMTVDFCTNIYGKSKELLTMQVRANTLEKIIDATPAGVCQLMPDENLTVVAANDIFYKMMGFRDEELKNGKPENPFIHLLGNELEFLHDKVEAILHSTENRGEFEFSTTDIYQKPITILVSHFRDIENGGNITVSILDITDRKHMEEELHIREEDYRLAIEASDHLYFNYDPATKTCTHMFDSGELFGISEKVEGIPESLLELGLCAPESVEDYRKAFRMFTEGVPKGYFALHLQNIKTHTYRWYGGNYRTVFDLNGNPIRAVVAFKDITEEREKEIAYYIHKQQIQSHPEDEINYFELNLTTDICYYSYGTQAKQLSVETSSKWDEMVKCAVERYVHPDYKASIREFLNTKHLLEMYDCGLTEAKREYRGYMSDSKVHWLHASVRLISDKRTNEIRAFCVIEDIDEEKANELERQLEKRRSQYYEDAYGRLASSVMYGVCKYSSDDDLTIIFANDIFYQMHGYHSQAEALAAGFTSILFAAPAFGKDLIRANHREYAQRKPGRLFETEYPTVDADGKRIWILCRGIYSPEEGIFNASVLNITDRKNAEEKLRISEERYRLALSQSGKVFFFFDVPSRTIHLSEDFAQSLGLPIEINNMPESYIKYGLVEQQSIEKFRHFYDEIYAGKPTGNAIISCHSAKAPNDILWYEVTFTSVFNTNGIPQSAIITYEDLREERANKIAGAWKQANLFSVPESKYMITEYNLTQNSYISQTGGLFLKIPESLNGYDETNAFVLDNFIYEKDIAAYKRFLDRNRLLEMFKEGKKEDTIEYRSLQSVSYPRWTSTSIQMIEDPYSGDVLAQLLIIDIHEEKSGQIEMAQNYEELKKELENSRIKVMINQMQPHFLYNALSAIQTIIKVDPDYAYNLIYDFTVHLRSSIKALSSDAPIPFTDELKNIKAYLNIEQMRFGDSLKVKYEIDCDHFSVIPLSIQPLAENAARHGVYPKGVDGGTVTVRTYETVNAYVVEVEDDGVGFNPQEVLEKGGDSVGLKNLIFRLKSLMNADVVVNSKIGIGTKVTVSIPKKGD